MPEDTPEAAISRCVSTETVSCCHLYLGWHGAVANSTAAPLNSASAILSQLN